LTLSTPKSKIKWFSPEEFQGWWEHLNDDLICKLDTLRDLYGQMIVISPVEGAVGRMAAGSRSQHNFEYWNEVRAVDVMPVYDRTHTMADFYYLARDVGFMGIGVYPLWRPRPGFHLDVRDDYFVTWYTTKENGEQVYNYNTFDEIFNTLKRLET